MGDSPGKSNHYVAETSHVEFFFHWNRFSQLSLNFKTDRETLKERRELQRAQREQTEQNLETELRHLNVILERACTSAEDQQIKIRDLNQQVEYIKQIALKLSNTAEELGAVEEELRVSELVETMTRHVEDLRAIHDKQQAELSMARRLLVSNKLSLDDSTSAAVAAATGAGAGVGGRRRASIAVLAPPSPSALEAPRTPHMVRLPTIAAPVASAAAAVGSSGALRRRRKSLDGSDKVGSRFTCIAEEREEEMAEEVVSHLPTPEVVEDLQRFAVTRKEESLRTAVAAEVRDELDSLRTEQDQLADDIRTLLDNRADTAINTPIHRWTLQELVETWPYTWEDVRNVCGGLFLAIGILVMLVPHIVWSFS